MACRHPREQRAPVAPRPVRDEARVRHHIDLAAARALVADGLSVRAIARRLHAHPMAVRRILAPV